MGNLHHGGRKTGHKLCHKDFNYRPAYMGVLLFGEGRGFMWLWTNVLKHDSMYAYVFYTHTFLELKARPRRLWLVVHLGSAVAFMPVSDVKVKRCAEVDLRRSFWCSMGPFALQREWPVEYNYINHEYIHSAMCVYVYI